MFAIERKVECDFHFFIPQTPVCVQVHEQTLATLHTERTIYFIVNFIWAYESIVQQL